VATNLSPSKPRAASSSLGSCPVCDTGLRSAGEDWLRKCPGCGFLSSTLTPDIEVAPDHSTLDEHDRAAALAPVRQANFRRILDLLARHAAPRGRLLEVGCGHGWFLKAAQEHGYTAQGLEPDPAMSRVAQQAGLEVATGYFPQDLPAGSQFDVLAFNDVFEHLPDVTGAMRACSQVLAPGGTLLINLPVQTGIFYRLASCLRHLGVRQPFERMWQKHFPSPHLSYFSGPQLRQLAQRHGLECVAETVLPSIQIRGLWQRLRYDRTSSRLRAALLYGGILCGFPILRLLPSDIRVFLFRTSVPPRGA
jgi:SAM-dependent methyltransferase